MDNYNFFYHSTELPESYNINILKLMYKSPNCMFAYWEIAQKKIDDFYKQFGQIAYETSRPIIKVINLTKNYHFFVEIKNNTNSWYITIADCNCNYSIQMGRRTGKGLFVELLSSNTCCVPADSPNHGNNKIQFANINHLTNYDKNKKFEENYIENIFIKNDLLAVSPLSSARPSDRNNSSFDNSYSGFDF